MIKVTPEILTAEAFAPFGQVIEVSEKAYHYPINNGTTERYHDLADLQANPEPEEFLPAKLIASIFRANPRSFPYDMTMMECHPLGSQLFMPINAGRWLTAVAPVGQEPDPEKIRVFIAGPGQGVNYNPNIWHHPLMAMDKICDFLIIDRSGSGCNLLEKDLSEIVRIEL